MEFLHVLVAWQMEETYFFQSRRLGEGHKTGFSSTLPLQDRTTLLTADAGQANNYWPAL